LFLTDSEKKILDGGHGEAAALAMAILTDLGDAVNAKRLVKISHVHTDSGFYLGDAGLEFVEHLAALNGRVTVPTSMNNTTYDIERCESYGVPGELGDKIKRIETAHLAMGVNPCWTCAPYQDGIRPKLGQNIAWSESNAIVFANSVFGARTNRTGDLLDICCALTGRAVETGLYLTQNRMARYHVILENFTQKALQDSRLYPLLGYAIGKSCGNKVVAVSGVPKGVTMDDLKGFGAAIASSGATALFHLMGVTPEAPVLENCFKNAGNNYTISMMPDDIRKAEASLTTAEDDRLDWVGLGCPHFSEQEFMTLYRLVKGRKIPASILFSVFTSRKILEWLKKKQLLKPLNDAGVKVYSDGCLLLYPNFIRTSGTMMTNSAKAANYVYSQSGFKAVYGSIEECVASAFNRKITRRRSR